MWRKHLFFNSFLWWSDQSGNPKWDESEGPKFWVPGWLQILKDLQLKSGPFGAVSVSGKPGADLSRFRAVPELAAETTRNGRQTSTRSRRRRRWWRDDENVDRCNDDNDDDDEKKMMMMMLILDDNDVDDDDDVSNDEEDDDDDDDDDS